jgi:hypothetical protein
VQGRTQEYGHERRGCIAYVAMKHSGAPEVSRPVCSTAYCLRIDGSLLGLFFVPEDGGDIFFRLDFFRIIQSYNPEEHTLHGLYYLLIQLEIEVEQVLLSEVFHIEFQKKLRNGLRDVWKGPFMTLA